MVQVNGQALANQLKCNDDFFAQWKESYTKLLKTFFAYLAAIVIVVVISVSLEQLAVNFERAFMTVVGLVLACVGLWLTFWPRAAMRMYEKNQMRERRWKEKYPLFMGAFKEVGGQVANTELGEALAQEVYRKTHWTRIFGVIVLLFGLVVFWALY